jgi:hypothetical protein
MNAVVAINGLTVTYTLQSALSANVQANFSTGKMVTVAPAGLVAPRPTTSTPTPLKRLEAAIGLCQATN